MTREELNEIFEAVGREMKEENVAIEITTRAMKTATSDKTVENLVSVTTAAAMEYSNELLFRLLARLMCKP